MKLQFTVKLIKSGRLNLPVDYQIYSASSDVVRWFYIWTGGMDLVVVGIESKKREFWFWESGHDQKLVEFFSNYIKAKLTLKLTDKQAMVVMK